jgi:hypothetical protein
MKTHAQRVGMVVVVMAVGCLALGAAGEASRRAVKVKIEDEKPVVVEAVLPVDPTPRIRYTPTQLAVQVRTEQNQTLHLSNTTLLNIDGQVTQAGVGGRFEKLNQQLPKTAGGRTRQGQLSVYVQGDLRITMTSELTPTKAPASGKRRELGAVLVRYTVENTGQTPRKFGLKMYMDTYVVTNDGCLFAAPNFPGKVLDGIELKEKTLPAFVQLLERPDLKNPGYVAHLTLDLGSSVEKPNRVVLTSLGAGNFNAWDIPAVQAMGDSAMAVFFDPKEIKPGGKRELAYAYGKGVAIPLDNEGSVEMRVRGSFEPGKSFTITAVVTDPPVGQALTLHVPKGVELLEGRDIQPVPPPNGDPLQSIVSWKGRVLEFGRFPISLRSSTGVTQTKIVTVGPSDAAP